MDNYLKKKYKLETSENFDEFMKALGVGLITRQIGNAVCPVVDLTRAGDEYIMSSSSTFHNVVQKFKPGVGMKVKTPDGRKIFVTFTLDGNTLHEQQIGADGRLATITRVFTDDEMTLVGKVGAITCVRIYKVIET